MNLIQSRLPLGAAIVQLTVEPEESAPERFREVMERTGKEIKVIELQQDIIEAVERLAIYKFPQISRQELEAMLGVADIKQTRIYQEAKGEGHEEGLEEGLEKGERKENSNRPRRSL